MTREELERRLDEAEKQNLGLLDEIKNLKAKLAEHDKQEIPDFPEFNRCSFLEAIGGMGNLSYVQSNAEKFANYTNNGLYLNRDIIFITGDESYRPDEISAKRIIGVMLDALAKMYVFRKT